MFDRNRIRFSLPDDEYLRLLGAALCVFDSNCGLIIEGILKVDTAASWHELVDKESGKLSKAANSSIARVAGTEITEAFDEIVHRRDRIVHAFRITSPEGDQILATKERGTGRQFHITEEYLWEFIRLNEELDVLLEQFRSSYE